MSNKVYLGMEEETKSKLYLEKHSWDCNWYWGFGYLDSSFMHFHFDSVMPNKSNNEFLTFNIFEKPVRIKLKKGFNGWLLMELFEQAYILRHAADMYSIGSAGITEARDKGVSKDMVLAHQLNEQLETVLDEIWELVGGKK